jgi:hypothetical protein
MTAGLVIFGFLLLVLVVLIATRCCERRIDAAIDRSLPYPRWH